MSIAVVICVYKPDVYIYRQLDSILNQSLKIDRLYVSDDSTDDIYKSNIANHLELSNFQDYKIFDGPKEGVASNFLYALSHVEEEYVFFSDQDDVWMVDKVENFISMFGDNENPKMVFSDAKVVDDNLNIISDSFFHYQGISEKVLEDDSILLRNCVQGASLAINRKLLELVLSSKSVATSIYMHDWWIAILCKYYGEFKYIDQPTMLYRQHSNNLVGAKNKSQLRQYISFGYIKSIYRISLQYRDFMKFSSIVVSDNKNEKPLEFKHCNYLKSKLLATCLKFIIK